MTVETSASHLPARKAGRPLVYIFGTDDGREVKIGITKGDVGVRKAQQENVNGHSESLRFLAAVRASQPSDERAIHRFFSKYRSRPRSKEWFWANDEIRGWIRSLQGQPYAASTVADVAGLPLVDPSYWYPGNVIAQPTQVQLAIDSDPWSDLIPDEVMEGDFYTDPKITDAAREAMGGIDLDPASCTFANRESVQAKMFYGYRDNGLLQPWAGRVWLNPPFGQWEAWSAKLMQEVSVGNVTQACVLATSRASTTRAMLPINRAAVLLWIPCGRIPFFGPHATSSPDEGHFVYYIGDRTANFRAAFTALDGTVWTGGQQ